MKNVILIHGLPDRVEYYDVTMDSMSNAHFFPWIQKHLCARDILCQTPEMPRPYDPIFEEWSEVIENFKITNDTILAGHSCGAGFLLRYLSEHKDIVPEKLVLIAPWVGYKDEDFLSTNFFNDRDFDWNMASRFPIELVYSTDDFPSVLDSIYFVKEKMPGMIIHELHSKGHFIESSIGKEFPELLEIILQ